MLSIFRLISVLVLAFFAGVANAITCTGRFPNPVTDICWKCIFPLNIGGVPIGGSGRDNGDPPPPLICTCPAPPPLFIRIGVGISFWEPARVAEVVRSPMCSPTLGGVQLGSLPVSPGTNRDNSVTDEAFYHVHWIQYPVLNWLGVAITSGACFINETFDIAYMSELDPLWGDDNLSFILNPEAVLFANPVAIAACAADTVAAAVSDFGLDTLFWCSGSQGHVYPLSGNHKNHVGGIDSSLAITHKMIAKLHRQLLAMDTSTHAAMCANMPQPILRKKQYKAQLMYPVPNPSFAKGFGAPSIWAAGREFPYKGEDFSWLMWRKRQCCAF